MVAPNTYRSTPSTQTPPKAPTLATAIGRVNNCVMNNFGGGRRTLKLACVINFQKLTTIPFLTVSIAWYHSTSTAAWIYLALQSTYDWFG